MTVLLAWLLARLSALSILAGMLLLVAAAAMLNEVAGVAAAGAAFILAGADVRWWHR